MDNFNTLKKWLKLDNDNLRMYKDGFRGIYSTKNIKENDIIIKIPNKYIIEYNKVHNKHLLNKLNNKNSLVATHILLESLKDNSFWQSYFDTFPKNLDEYIYYYDKQKLKTLKDTSIMCKGVYNFNKHMKNVIDDSKLIYKYLLKKNKLPEQIKLYSDFYNLFLKYRIYVCSRIFGYVKNSNDELGMVPYADLLNHSAEPNTTWRYDDNMKSFIVVATKDIPKNTEIYDSYGNKTNVQLVMYYGFSIKNNIHSVLNFMHKNQLYELDHESSKDILSKSVIKKLSSILNHHTDLIKSGSINDHNILNIYNDEISIINKHLFG